MFKISFSHGFQLKRIEVEIERANQGIGTASIYIVFRPKSSYRGGFFSQSCRINKITYVTGNSFKLILKNIKNYNKI
jgi:hypothetical protein